MPAVAEKPVFKNAKEVLLKHWDRRLPVDPESLGISLGMEVKNLDPFNSEDSKLSGKFQMEDGKPVAYYKATEHENRQRFAIAHEIGHYVLGHGDSLRDPAANFSSNNHDYKEVAANHFAAQLLMPKGSVLKAVRELRITSISKLADRFKVSEVAMLYRLKNLGLAS